MPPDLYLITTLILLLGLFLLSGIQAAYRHLLPRDLAAMESTALGLLFFRPIQKFLWPNSQTEATRFCLVCTLNLLRFCYGVIAMVWLKFLNLHEGAAIGFILALFIVGFLCGDYLPKLLAAKYPQGIFRLCAPLGSLYLLAALPLCWPLFVTTRRVANIDPRTEEIGQELLEMVQELDLTAKFDAHDKKLIESVIDFRHQLAKEVMVPRVDVFSLPGHMPLREATKLLDPEGYSRIPVYGSSIDEIKGVLMQKDVLRKYMEYEATGNKEILDIPIEKIVKEVIFTPETKKISILLQEFRNKQVHLAIVVDEYGGTEGIVTIEDILEQIVGEIADEYDEDEALFATKAEGGWIVDARMSILDVEEKLDVTIPEEGDYDTLAGFVFFCAGSIPSKGFVIHRDNFELEVVSSNDRMVEKVWLKPVKSDE